MVIARMTNTATNRVPKVLIKILRIKILLPIPNPLLPPSRKTLRIKIPRNEMSLKLIRKTASGDLQLDGIPVFIAGSVTTEADLPVSEDRIGAAYFVGNSSFCVWNGKSWTRVASGGGNDSGHLPCAAEIDNETINQLLLKTGFTP